MELIYKSCPITFEILQDPQLGLVLGLWSALEIALYRVWKEQCARNVMVPLGDRIGYFVRSPKNKTNRPNNPFFLRLLTTPQSALRFVALFHDSASTTPLNTHSHLESLIMCVGFLLPWFG